MVASDSNFEHFLVPMRPRGNAVQTRQRHRFKFDEFNHWYPFFHFDVRIIFYQYDKKQSVKNRHA